MQNPSKQQFGNLFIFTNIIVNFCDEENNYEKEKEEILKLFFDPILELKKKYPHLKLGKTPVDWNIANLEICYNRDTQFNVKLSKEYYVDAIKRQETKKITLAQATTVLFLFKLELSKLLSKIVSENDIAISIELPSGIKAIEQQTGDSFA